MNQSTLRGGPRQNRSVDVIDFAKYTKRLEPEDLGTIGEVWSRYSPQATIMSVLAELRHERRALEKVTRTLERILSMRRKRSGSASRGMRKPQPLR
jgi:hypothetical protein